MPTETQFAGAREPSSQKVTALVLSASPERIVTRLVSALNSWATTTPESTTLVAEPNERPSRRRTQPKAVERAGEGADREGEGADAEHQDQDRSCGGAGRHPEQVGVGQRIARQRLEDRTAHREPRPHQRGEQHARQPQVPYDAVAQRGHGVPGAPRWTPMVRATSVAVVGAAVPKAMSTDSGRSTVQQVRTSAPRGPVTRCAPLVVVLVIAVRRPRSRRGTARPCPSR
ncbi:hypothetical protein SALBM135S_06462 [Streptomyces alboniger]